MRSGSKGSIYRRLVLVALAIVVVGLVAVPSALASSMVIAGLVQGQYYGGARPIAATVTVPDPAHPGSNDRSWPRRRPRTASSSRPSIRYPCRRTPT